MNKERPESNMGDKKNIQKLKANQQQPGIKLLIKFQEIEGPTEKKQAY